MGEKIENDRGGGYGDGEIPLWRRMGSVGVLTLLHAMTFADRFSVAGALAPLVDFYGINNTEAGLIQTLFLAATILGAPITGYFGDRYNRKWMMSMGVVVWIGVMIASSFVPKNMFWLFLVLRCIDGLSENFVYACAPSMIADYFSGQARSYAYMFFYYAINVGAAFGVMVGSAIADSTPDWQWALRYVPAITIVGWMGLILIVQEPKRENANDSIDSTETKKHFGSFFNDLRYLVTIKTFILQCFGAAFINFTTGAQGWWNSAIIYYSIDYNKNVSTDQFNSIFHHNEYKTTQLVTGFVGIVSTISGVSFVVYWAESWRNGRGIFKRIQTVRAPALVIAISLSLAAPCSCITQLFVLWNVYGYYATQFVGGFFMGAAWVLNLDVLYSTTSSTRRATSIMMWTLMQHLLGDGPSPYIAGSIADAFRGDDESSHGEMWALLKSFFIINSMTIPAALTHYVIAWTMKSDLERNQEIEKKLEEDEDWPEEHQIQTIIRPLNDVDSINLRE